MTRISKQRFSAAASGLLAIAFTTAGVAQETAAERYARTLAEADITARYNVQLEQQLQSQAEEIASLEMQIAGLDATAVDVQPLLQQMFDELVQFVANDVPFFKEERDQRIERLRELVSRVDATPSEKFRRLLEAYQIEMEYGRTMSAYRQTLADGREADMVRLGRVTLLYRTSRAARPVTGTTSARSGCPIPDPRAISRTHWRLRRKNAHPTSLSCRFRRPKEAVRECFPYWPAVCRRRGRRIVVRGNCRRSAAAIATAGTGGGGARAAPSSVTAAGRAQLASSGRAAAA